jgi:hypothetical protein
LKPVIDDCIILLEDFDEDSTKPASLILRSVASASCRLYFLLREREVCINIKYLAFSYSLVERVILPILLRQYRETTAEMEHYLIICTIVALIQARKMAFGIITDDNMEEEEGKGKERGL